MRGLGSGEAQGKKLFDDAYPEVSIFANLRRNQVTCLSSFGRKSVAIPKLARASMTAPEGAPG